MTTEEQKLAAAVVFSVLFLTWVWWMCARGKRIIPEEKIIHNEKDIEDLDLPIGSEFRGDDGIIYEVAECNGNGCVGCKYKPLVDLNCFRPWMKCTKDERKDQKEVYFRLKIAPK